VSHISTLPLKTGKENISFSELKDWAECSWRHKLKHVDKIDLFEENVYTNFGTAIHASCEEYIKTREMRHEISLDMISESWDEYDLPEMGLWLKRSNAILDAVPGFLDERFPGWECFEAEEKLMETIPNPRHKNVKFKGFIDAALKHKDEYWLLDWKGQRLTAPILTPNGWTTMGQLKIGDEITSSDGGITKVIGIFPLGVKDVYRVSMRDGSYTDVTNDHLWKVHSNNYPKHKILTTKELMHEKRYLYIDTFSSPVMFSKKDSLKIDPYVMGCLLGDGGFTDKIIKFTTSDDSLIQAFKDRGYSVGYCDESKTPAYTILKIKKEIQEYGLYGLKSHEKYIPEDFLWSSSENRLSLICGLLDTDGWVQKGIPKFSTTSKALAEGMQHLVRSLGGITFMSSRPIRKGANHIEYVVTVRLPRNMVPFKLKRKLEKWNPNPSHKVHRRILKIEKVGQDEMQCIKVDAPDSLYVTDDFILTHNTANAGWNDWKKNDNNLRMQLVLYNLFWSNKHEIDPEKVRCGFVILNRDLDAPNRIDFFTFKITDAEKKKSLKVMNKMLTHVKNGKYFKRWKYQEPRKQGFCRFCDYNGTKYCP
jgi:hypothetical protein